MAVGVGEPPRDLGLRGRNTAGTEQNALGLLLPENGVLRADRLLERRNEVALLDREITGKRSWAMTRTKGASFRGTSAGSGATSGSTVALMGVRKTLNGQM